jgi:predicted ribosome quality control (RQC) complex YloA/Tae2 family protein
MIRNYYTLLHLSNEINNLSGFAVKECWTQESDSLIIELSDSKTSKCLIFRSDGKHDAIFIRNQFARAGKNSVSLLEEITDELFQSCEVFEKERIIRIRFINTLAYFVLFGGENSNVFITNRDDTIIDAFKNPSKHMGEKFVVESRVIPSINDFNSETITRKAVASSDFLFGSIYAEELINKIGLNPDLPIGEFSGADIDLLLDSCDKFRDKLIYDPVYMVYEDDDSYTFSLTTLTKFPLVKQFDSISEAIGFTISNNIKSGNFDKLSSDIKKALEFSLSKNQKQLQSMKNDENLLKSIKDYKTIGDLLMAYPENAEHPGKLLEMEDENGIVHKIKLEPKYSIYKNATYYFQKSKTAESELNSRAKRIPSIEKKIESINLALIEFGTIENVKALEKFKDKHKHLLSIKMEFEKKTPEDKYKKFELGEGFTVYVGKNAANNDELTMRFAKPNDLWLHARGTSGSHVVLKLNKPEKPPKHILEKAAEVAAYYSGARNAKYVPVIYTFKKFVRKPKGANIGAVVVSKEEVIMVEPKLPAGNQD